MRIHRSILILIILILITMLILPAAGCAGKTDNKLVVGMELAYPPFETTDEQNNPTGISVDFAKALGEELGREVVIENIAWTGLIPSLLTNKVDLIISSMTITDDRKEQVDFSDPYAMSNLALLINKDSDVQTYDDLLESGKTLAVKKGSTGHIYAQLHLPEENFLVFDKESACVLEVIQGKVDAFTYDQLTIYRNWQQYPDDTRANLVPYQEAPEYWGVAIRKGNNELRDQVNAFIAKYREQGGFDDLSDTYLSEQKQVFEDLSIPFFFNVEAGQDQ